MNVAEDVAASLQAGIQLLQTGRLDEARALYEDIVARHPDHPDALHLLGVAVAQLGDPGRGLALMARSVEHAPDRVQFLANLAKLQCETGHPQDAIGFLDRAVALAPGNADLHHLRGSALKDLGRLDEAEASLRSALSIDSSRAAVHNELGLVLHELGRIDEAIRCFDASLAILPISTEARNHRGVALRTAGRLAEAVACFQEILSIEPGRIEALYNLGNTLADSHRSAEAIDVFRRLLAVRPDHVVGHVHLGFALLVVGDFKQGFEEYEWRWRIPGFPGPPHAFAEPVWDGKPLAGRTLLLCAEQGLGDSIQFLRYAPLIEKQGGRIVVEVQPELAAAATSVGEVDLVVARGAPLPPFDCYAWLLSLPRLFGTTPATIPAKKRYMTPEPARVDAWTPRLDRLPGLKVGIAWRGSAQHPNDRNRSCALSLLRPLFEVPGVSWVSLQKGRTEADGTLPANVLDVSADLADFAETAAVLAHLDLVIAVDTAVAHLAGALGRPVWLMLPFAPDWRWSLGREDSPWYPSFELFRQDAPGDWAGVVARLCRELGSMAGRRRRA